MNDRRESPTPEPRRAPLEMRLPTPRHVLVASVALGAGTLALGLGYATTYTYRRPELQRESVVALIEQPLGWLMAAAGLWVAVAAVAGAARASAHAVAAVLHGSHLAALVATFVLAYPYQSVQGVALGLFGLVAHGGASIDYWKRGHR